MAHWGSYKVQSEPKYCRYDVGDSGQQNYIHKNTVGQNIPQLAVQSAAM